MFSGKHMIKSWSSTQQVMALSSGEAELYGMLKGATQGAHLHDGGFWRKDSGYCVF